ncbi:hypothetical protein R0131_08720 [Clostridium sp. AL.422]|uniref:hypothetical protein n=1 Tax=Clostridium TaxID=1485 RepID=UPI00293DAF4C|nr:MULTISPECIES: hypothetical protein [unclassified Clostridium]MDV4150917.1 hypothetical protein [Clostridium sp. AL.422]
MRKPSIFSRDYERQMRKRRRRIAIISVLGILFIGILFLKIAIDSINMDTLRSKVQNWIDEDEKDVQNDADNIEQEITQEEVTQEEAPKVPESKTMDLIVKEGTILKVEYEDINGVVKFKGIKDAPSNIYTALNPDNNLVLTIDENQNMKIFNVQGKEANITKDKYIAPNGEVFNKESVLQTYNGYLWNVDAKFITNTKVAYISNVPYFGYNLSKYIWVVDLNDNSHKTLWNSKSTEIKFNEIKEKGLEVTIDGNVKYINSNGELIN